MLKIQKFSLSALLVGAVIFPGVFAQEKAQLDVNEASYAVGALMGTQVKELTDSQKGVINYDNAQILAGIKDALDGKVNVREDQKVQATLEAIQQKLVADAQAKVDAQAKATETAGEKYRAEFAKQKGVKKTADGLLYRVVAEGKGEKPKATDVVKVHYTGKTVDGKVFDSSVERGSPVEFKLNQVIKGWQEGLPLIKKGGKIELVIPAELAYGKDGAGAAIPPNSTLYFEVELLDINPKK